MRKLVVFCALTLSASSGLAEEAKVSVSSPLAPVSTEQDASPSSPQAESESIPPPAEPSSDAPGVKSATPPLSVPSSQASQSAAPVSEKKAQPPAASTLSLIARGDAAFVSKDLESACAAYQGAIMVDPKAPMAHLRLAECQMAQGKLDDAVQSSEAGLRIVEPGSRLQLVALSRQGVIFETRGELDKALGTYKLLLTAIPSAKDAAARTIFERIGRERSSAIETRKKELSDAAIVKARIDEELADAAPKKSSGGPAIVPSKPLTL